MWDRVTKVKIGLRRTVEACSIRRSLTVGLAPESNRAIPAVKVMRKSQTETAE
jgi:hypothetical protein